MPSRRRAVSLALTLTLVLLGASWWNIARAQTTAVTAGGAVTLLVPDKTDPQWAKDASSFVSRLQSDLPDVKWVVLDAHGSEATQIQQAQTAIASGAKVLVVAPVNGESAGQIVPAAHKKHVAVIAYDSPIDARKLDLFVGFDPEAVGMLQGTFIAKHMPAHGRLVFINGPADNDVAEAEYKGSFGHVIKPKLDKRKFSLGGTYWTSSWSSTDAEDDMIDALFRNHSRIEGVVAASDSLAAGVIRALVRAHVPHPVPLTGSDASVAGIRALIEGTQSMTVYKPVYREANAAADAAVSILMHKPLPKEFKTMFRTKAGTVKSALSQPEPVTRSTIVRTVLKDHFVTQAEICTGLAALCKKYHI